MFSLSNMPSSTTVLSTYTSVAGSMMLFRSISNEIIPHQIRSYISSIFQKYFFNPTTSSSLTLIIEEFFDGYSRNEVYEATEIFLRTKITPSIDRLIITKAPRDVKLSITIERGQEIIDVFQGIQMKWALVSSKKQDDSNSQGGPEHKSFELSFQKRHKDFVLESYMPYVLNRAKILKEENRVLKLHTLGGFCSDYDNSMWGSINLEHPTTFDKLAMDPNMKKELMEDLDRFVRRRDFYKKVGKAWKRGYLLYGPPGTGKSSLIAAMANYLHFDVFDLELGNVYSNTELRRVFVATNNRSIVVIEDIDCTTLELHDRSQEHQKNDAKLTLSGLLNFIDGLWSSCGDERIIVFTTNHKDRLDPALLRPGRMDMHIHMSYCTFDGFKLLASNYLSIDDHHELLKEIEILMEEDSQITPAEIAEELMKSDDDDIALGSVVKLLKKKKKKNETERTEGGDQEEEEEEEKETQEKENETRSN